MAAFVLILAAFRRAWCRLAHTRIMLPICGVYRCAVCLEEYSVPWSTGAPTVTAKASSAVALTMEEA